jgi:FkbM family methyltransferase
MSNSLLSKIKPFTPKYIQRVYRKYRKWERFNKRFLVNQGKPSLENIVTEGESFKIVINPYVNGCVDDVIASDGVWEPLMSKKIKELLPPNGTFIDIGANIGYHSLFAATLHNRTTNIIAFEPQKNIYEMFRKSITENVYNNIQLYNCGLSNYEGTAALNIFEENKGASSLTQGITHHSGEAMVEEIQIKQLDSFLNEVQRADIIKIDVEGFEYEVVLGGLGLIRKYQPALFIEFSPGLYNLRDTAITQKFITLLSDLDYKTYTIEGEPLNLDAWSAQALLDTDQIDILCVVNK